MAGLQYGSTYIFARASIAGRNFVIDDGGISFELRPKLPLIVERRDHNVASLVTTRVEPVVMDDPSPNGIVRVVDPRHPELLSTTPSASTLSSARTKRQQE
jgi:hypothetical protein